MEYSDDTVPISIIQTQTATFAHLSSSAEAPDFYAILSIKPHITAQGCLLYTCWTVQLFALHTAAAFRGLCVIRFWSEFLSLCEWKLICSLFGQSQKICFVSFFPSAFPCTYIILEMKLCFFCFSEIITRQTTVIVCLRVGIQPRRTRLPVIAQGIILFGFTCCIKEAWKANEVAPLLMYDIHHLGLKNIVISTCQRPTPNPNHSEK